MCSGNNLRFEIPQVNVTSGSVTFNANYSFDLTLNDAGTRANGTGVLDLGNTQINAEFTKQ